MDATCAFPKERRDMHETEPEILPEDPEELVSFAVNLANKTAVLFYGNSED